MTKLLLALGFMVFCAWLSWRITDYLIDHWFDKALDD